MKIDNAGAKLASHVFERQSEQFAHKCKKCGFVAFSYGESPPTVFANLYKEILSCDEAMIKDIIE
jgi:predicted nucleic-acid-binding Zn-ribbon protein